MSELVLGESGQIKGESVKGEGAKRKRKIGHNEGSKLRINICTKRIKLSLIWVRHFEIGTIGNATF